MTTSLQQNSNSDTSTKPLLKPGFLSLSRHEWADLSISLGIPAYRGSQIADWIFKKFATSVDAMTNLNRDLKQHLSDHLDWKIPECVSELQSDDGSTKLLLKTAAGQFIESVILRYENRVTLCVSSQVGCKMACSFCQTGKLGFFRNLSTHEILAQFVFAQRILNAEGRRLSHVVFMGMGEPLDNYANVVKSVKILTSPDGYGLSNRHVTISTSGVVPKIAELANDVKCALAISLHASRNDLRDELMPINRKWPLEQLKDSLIQYQQTTGQKITLEYILIKDKTSGIREAKELVKFIHGLQAKVNLIPFNSHPGLPYDRPSADEIRAFQEYLAERSIASPVRYSKGLDVSAACGQLAAKTIHSVDAAPERKRVIGIEPSLT
ncbi:MAG: 23S rRNA (adenine(2503)-C(2))-methyltransferase RlmN [Proteobacteria bacterium]|nr:23S rRNA (adenine(2503)-C(2))-methyltransferase RlmN [Pseudomonadota bacterium]